MEVGIKYWETVSGMERSASVKGVPPSLEIWVWIWESAFCGSRAGDLSHWIEAEEVVPSGAVRVRVSPWGCSVRVAARLILRSAELL